MVTTLYHLLAKVGHVSIRNFGSKLSVASAAIAKITMTYTFSSIVKIGYYGKLLYHFVLVCVGRRD